MGELNEEAKTLIQNFMKNNSKRFSEPKYQCPQCSGGMCMDEYVEPKYSSKSFRHFYMCNKCGHMEYGQ